MMNNTPTPLGEDFFHRDCLDVAPDLVGKLIIRNTDEGEIRLRITETESYRGEEDTACHAADHGNEVVILDTAGRLHIDEQLMDELKSIKEETNPHEIMLVVDAMTGQDAVNVAKAFDDALGITGVLMSKLDSDTRGGGAPSAWGGRARQPLRW